MTESTALQSPLIEEINLTVPHMLIEKHVDALLIQKAKTVKMSGFRPGKVPMHLVKDIYLGACVEDALKKTIQNECNRVLTEKHIRTAIRPIYDVAEGYTYGQDLNFKLKIEKYPTFEITNVQSIEIDRISYDFQDEDLGPLLKSIPEFIKSFDPAPEGRKLEFGDVLHFDMSVMHKGKEISHLCVQDSELVMHDHDELRRAFVKHMGVRKVGEEFTYTVSVPKKHRDKKIAGKEITHKVTILGHEIPSEREATIQDYMKLSRLKTEAEALEYFKDLIIKQREQEISLYHKRLLLDALAQNFQFDLPPTLVEKEFEFIWGHLQEELKHLDDKDYDANTIDEMKVEYQGIAQRRVKLGLVIAEIAKQENLSLTNRQIAEIVREESIKYGEEEKKFFEYYKNNGAALQELIAPYVEEMVVRFLLSRMKKEPKPLKLSEMTTLFKGVLPGYDDELEEELEVTKKKPAKKKAIKKVAPMEDL